MLTILGTFLGLLGSFAPKLLDYFERKQTFQQEKDLLEIKAKHAREGVQLEINKIQAEATAKEGESVRSHDSAVDGGRFINAIRASVRPFITYMFFFVFVFVKAYTLWYVTNTGGLNLLQALPLIWDEETKAIFASIMAFWFGSRIIDSRFGPQISSTPPRDFTTSSTPPTKR